MKPATSLLSLRISTLTQRRANKVPAAANNTVAPTRRMLHNHASDITAPPASSDAGRKGNAWRDAMARALLADVQARDGRCPSAMVRTATSGAATTRADIRSNKQAAPRVTLRGRFPFDWN